MRALACIVMAGGLAACVEQAPSAAQWRICDSGGNEEARIEACSAVARDESLDASQRAAALVQRGMLRRDYGEYARAVADFGRALRLDARSADAYVERGLVHQERGAFEIAVRDFDAALAIDPNIPLAIERREAALQGREGAFQSEFDRLTQALAHNPQDLTSLNNRCWLLAVSGRELDTALADCDTALEINPQYSAALDSRGLVHLKRGEFEAAVADYDAALALEPGRGHYLYGRGVARIRMGLSDAGHDDLSAAENAEPGIGYTYQNDYGVRL